MSSISGTLCSVSSVTVWFGMAAKKLQSSLIFNYGGVINLALGNDDVNGSSGSDNDGSVA